MFSEPIRNIMEQKEVLIASPNTSVSTAAKLMAKNQVGAVMVVENKRLIGIFTERDAVFRVIAKDCNTETTRLADVMTTTPKTVTPDDSFGYALLLMQENGFRHVPVIENSQPIGIVSGRNALDPELEEFEPEIQRRKQIQRQSGGG